MIIWLYLSFYELTNTSVLSKVFLLKKTTSFIVIAYKPYHCCFQAAATSPLRAALSPAWRAIREQIKIHVSKGPQEWTLADNTSQHHPQRAALGSLWGRGGREGKPHCPQGKKWCQGQGMESLKCDEQTVFWLVRKRYTLLFFSEFFVHSI